MRDQAGLTLHSTGRWAPGCLSGQWEAVPAPQTGQLPINRCTEQTSRRQAESFRNPPGHIKGRNQARRTTRKNKHNHNTKFQPTVCLVVHVYPEGKLQIIVHHIAYHNLFRPGPEPHYCYEEVKHNTLKLWFKKRGSLMWLMSPKLQSQQYSPNNSTSYSIL